MLRAQYPGVLGKQDEYPVVRGEACGLIARCATSALLLRQPASCTFAHKNWLRRGTARLESGEALLLRIMGLSGRVTGLPEMRFPVRGMSIEAET